MKHLLFAGVICLVLAMGAWAAGDPNLVIYYSFDSFTTVVPDESGKGHDAMVVGDVKPDPAGKRKGAARFAKTAYLDLNGPAFPAADIPVDAVTLCAWANPENTGDHEAIFNARAADQTWIIHPEFRSSGKVRWLLRAPGGVTIFNMEEGQWTPNQWIHYAGVYDSKTGLAILYLNGEKIKEMQGDPANPKIAADWGLGARVGKNIDDARPFAGLLDDLCLFKRALTQDEIKALMVNGPQIAATVPTRGVLTTTWGAIRDR